MWLYRTVPVEGILGDVHRPDVRYPEMPRISKFFGISIYLYYADTSRHKRPHFHGRYGEHEAVYSIPDGDVLAGSLTARQERMVQGWAALRAHELEQAWTRAVNMQEPGTIEPLT